MTRAEKKALLLQLIAVNAATAGGFFTAHAKRIDAVKNATSVCRDMAEAGLLIRLRTNKSTYGYFSTQALADAYWRQHRNDVLQRAATLIAFAPRVPKQRPVVEIVKPAHVQTRVFLAAPPRTQFTPLPAFIHNGYGAMR